TLHLAHLHRCPLDGGSAVALAAPALDVPAHLVDTALFLLYVLAEPAYVRLVERPVDQLHAACLARAIFLVALLPELPPLPESAPPAAHLVVAHSLFFSLFILF